MNTIGILKELQDSIQHELDKQDARADKRMSIGKDCTGADGQAQGLEKALGMIVSKIDTLQHSPARWAEQVAQTCFEACELLEAGKKVAIHRNYYTETPKITLTGRDGEVDEFTLDCVPTGKCETYGVEKPINLVDTVSISGYEETSQPIKYIYSNPQVNRVIAHLADGSEVPYCFDIIDIVHCYAGEFKTTVNVHLDFLTKSQVAGVKKTVNVMNMNVQSEEPDEIVDYILHNVHVMPEADIVLTIPGTEGTITISSDTRDQIMTEDYLSGQGD